MKVPGTPQSKKKKIFEMASNGSERMEDEEEKHEQPTTGDTDRHSCHTNSEQAEDTDQIMKGTEIGLAIITSIICSSLCINIIRMARSQP